MSALFFFVGVGGMIIMTSFQFSLVTLLHLKNLR